MGNIKVMHLKIPILMYHEITDNPSSAVNYSAMHPSYFIYFEKFRSQLDIISALNIKTITLGLLTEENDKKKKIQRLIISFDDGRMLPDGSGQYEAKTSCVVKPMCRHESIHVS